MTDECWRGGPETTAPRTAEAPTLVLARRGHVAIERASASELLTPGQVLVLRAGEEYRLSIAAAQGIELTTLAYPGLRAGRSTGAHRPLPSAAPHPRRLEGTMAPPAILLGLHRLRHRVRLGTIGAAGVDSDAMDLLHVADVPVRPARGGSAAARGDTLMMRRALVDRARVRLAGDPAAPHLLDELARAVGSSPFHLTRVFGEVVGLSVRQYLLRLRLALALDGMGCATATLSRVALDLGFSTHSHLTHRFRREFGCSPAAYQRSLRPRETADSRRTRAVTAG